jgi:predicted negative regulator of RcsB-dependent stress response
MDVDENVKIRTKKTLPIFVVWFVVGILVGAGALFAWNFYTIKNQAKVAAQVQQAQVKDIIAKVSKLIILPTGEDPVVATINDAATLSKEQVFYKGAKNGDIVLVYQKAAKAIVYSPDRNIIVNVGPIYSQDQQQQTTIQPATSTKKK